MTNKSVQHFPSARAKVLDAFGQLVTAWRTGDAQKLASLTTGTFRLLSNAHGILRGAAAISRFEDDAQYAQLSLETTNHFAAANGATGELSAYIYGQFGAGSEPRSLFGGTMTASPIRCRLAVASA